MSNFIPIVSSSPPPMDDSGGFDHWDDDDFGTFTGADDSILSTPGKASDWNTPVTTTDNGDASAFASWTQSGVTDRQGNIQSTADSGISDFANFGNIEENPSSVEPCDSNNENRPKTIEIDAHISNEPVVQEGEVIKHSLTDSGLCSSEVSPMQHSDMSDSGDKDHSDSDSIDEFHLDRTSTENTSDRTSVKSEHISDGEAKSSLANEEENQVISETVIPKLKQDTENIPDSNLSETNGICDEEGQVNESVFSMATVTPDNIPQVQNSSHSFDDDDEKDHSSVHISQPPAQQDVHNSAANQTVCSEKEVINDTYEMTANVIQCDSENNEIVDESQEYSALTEKTSGETDSSLTSRDDNDFQERSNCDLETDLDTDASKVSQSVNSMPVKTDAEELQNFQPRQAFADDSGKSMDNGILGSGIHEETTQNLGSCNIGNENSDGSQKDSDLNLCTENINDRTDTKIDRKSSDPDFKDSSGKTENVDGRQTVESEDLNDNLSKYKEDDASFECDNDGKNTNRSHDNEIDDNRTPDSENVDQQADENDSDVCSTVKLEKLENTCMSEQVTDEDDFDDFNAFPSVNEDKTQTTGEREFNDFTAFSSDKSDGKDRAEFGKFSDEKNDFEPDTCTQIATSASEFGAFSDTGSSFAAFGSESAAKDGESSNQADDWAAFSEPQISQTEAASEIDDDEWASFGSAEEQTVVKKEVPVTVDVGSSQPSLQNMSKQEKVLLAVTGCFSSVVSVAESEMEEKHEDLLNVTKTSEGDIWNNMRGLKVTNALGYHWSQSQWNNHLYSTLRVDTRNILFGHKKSSSMPIFASNLTMLEPTKGPMGAGSRSQETLIDTSKPDDSQQVYTQNFFKEGNLNDNQEKIKQKRQADSIPPAQFDWSSSGLTNPLEAANKTLNLDFLIQESEQTSGKSYALESEFLGPEDTTSHKPAAIQPLENILANLKSSSTFKPTNQNEDLSQEASRIIQSLPNLSFMKTKVLMFPLKLSE